MTRRAPARISQKIQLRISRLGYELGHPAPLRVVDRVTSPATLGTVDDPTPCFRPSRRCGGLSVAAGGACGPGARRRVDAVALDGAFYWHPAVHRSGPAACPQNLA